MAAQTTPPTSGQTPVAPKMTLDDVKTLKKGDVLIFTNEKNGTTSTWTVDYPYSTSDLKKKLTISETPKIDDPDGNIQPKPARAVAVPTVAGGGDCECKLGCVRVSTEVPNGRGLKRFSMLIKDFTNWSKQEPDPNGGSGGTGGSGRSANVSQHSLAGSSSAPTMKVVNSSTPVTLTELLPTVNQLDVDPKSTIILTFSGSVKLGTGLVTIQDTAGTDVQTINVPSSNIIVKKNVVTITPSSELKNQSSYQVSISKDVIKDTSGTSIDVFGSNVYQFTVK